jgi:hypothetical protein
MFIQGPVVAESTRLAGRDPQASILSQKFSEVVGPSCEISMACCMVLADAPPLLP